MFFINLPLENLPEFSLLILFTILLFVLLNFFINKNACEVFLLDYTCYKPPASQMCSRDLAVERSRLYGTYSEQTLHFMKKTLDRSGLGDSTYLAESLIKEPPITSMEGARREVEMSIFGSIDMLLAKNGVDHKNIGILVVNCCVFNMVPSLSSMVVNKYKLRDDIVSYNLTGMGCSAGLIAIGLAKQLLKVHHNSVALVVSTESITENVYLGKDRAMFLTNCLFRVGCAAILLSNRASDKQLSKYRLVHTVHTHTASSDRCYNCIYQEEDEDGNKGITITKDLLTSANRAIESNLTSLGYLILPLSEKLIFLTNYVMRQLCLSKIGVKIQPYVPNFNEVVDHFFPHVGGKPVLDELQKNLGLSDTTMEASRMTLYRFGNTSSSSVWYELAYAEAKERVKKGDRVWQIAFGSGFKCSSVILQAMRNIEYDEMNPWSEEINNFPVDLDRNGSMPYFFEPSK